MRLWAYACLLSTAVWYVYATNGPDECIRISVRELEYLRQHGIGKAPHHDKKGRHAPFPYALFRFSQAWAVIIAHAAFNFGRYFVSTFWSGKYLIASASSGSRLLPIEPSEIILLLARGYGKLFRARRSWPLPRPWPG